MPVTHNSRIGIEDRVNDTPQGPGTFAVDDSDLQDVSAYALLDVSRDKVLDVGRTEGVKIKGPVGPSG